MFDGLFGHDDFIHYDKNQAIGNSPTAKVIQPDSDTVK